MFIRQACNDVCQSLAHFDVETGRVVPLGLNHHISKINSPMSIKKTAVDIGFELLIRPAFAACWFGLGVGSRSGVLSVALGRLSRYRFELLSPPLSVSVYTPVRSNAGVRHKPAGWPSALRVCDTRVG